ncbi:MAG: glycosyltransferase family A protein [Pseudomonadota bacterium]
MTARVAIITRTKDRPLLLNRAAESVSRQNYDNYIWVVVNDGGDEADVAAVIGSCNVPIDRIRLISNEQSLGMEAASNIGVCQSESDFIVIHDDDDTLHPDFLTETVSFLESEEGQIYGGVATGVEYVSEEISGEDVVVHGRYPYLDYVKQVEFAELMAQNVVTTISFLYRRDVYQEIGGYREDLPVLGDWYFNIEFLLRADIKVIGKTLAYYHHRDRPSGVDASEYSNSVIADLHVHEEYAALVRNKLVREHLGGSGIAPALVMGYYAREARQKAAHLTRQSSSGRWSDRAIDTLLAEHDRLWVLSLVQGAKREKWLLGAKRFATADPASSLQKLARIAKDRMIALEAPANFDDRAYIKANPDVAAEVKAGNFNSGFEHYALFGQHEDRRRPATL